jgi:exosortase family protein XrtG
MMLKYQAYVLLFLEKVLGLYTVSFKELVVMIDTKTGFVTMILNYECSAIIEMLVYTCLILFFPFTNIREKVIKSIWGNIYIFLCNTLRLLFIMVMVKVLGIEYYRMIHTVLARILFFVFMVILYYLVFTKEQLVKQKVGEMGL